MSGEKNQEIKIHLSFEMLKSYQCNLQFYLLKRLFLYLFRRHAGVLALTTTICFFFIVHVFDY